MVAVSRKFDITGTGRNCATVAKRGLIVLEISFFYFDIIYKFDVKSFFYQ